MRSALLSLLCLGLLLCTQLPLGARADAQPASAAGGGIAVTPSAKPEPNFVRELTDDNFEHDTQATTGSTTGDWFVEFYAPWCGHCRTLAPTWRQLSVSLRDERIPVTLAAMDATVHTRTAKRFDIRGFPSLRLLSRGRVYDYTGARTLEAMQSWLESRAWESKAPDATGQPQQAQGRPIPPEVSALDAWKLWAHEASQDVVMLVWRKPAAAATIAALGLMLGVLASMLCWIAFLEPKPVIYQIADNATPTTPTTPSSSSGAAGGNASAATGAADGDDADGKETDGVPSRRAAAKPSRSTAADASAAVAAALAQQSDAKAGKKGQ